MGPFLIAWLVGMGLSISKESYIYRTKTVNTPNATNYLESPLPPKPGRLLVASGIYVGLAVVAEAPSMRSTATLAAWGYNVAIALNFAQIYANNKANPNNQANNPNTTGTRWWTPPAASGDVLFPNGTGGSPNAKPTAVTGTGTQVA